MIGRTPSARFLRVGLAQPHYPYITDEDKFRYYLPRVEPFTDQTLRPPLSLPAPVRLGVDATEREIRRAVRPTMAWWRRSTTSTAW